MTATGQVLAIPPPAAMFTTTVGATELFDVGDRLGIDSPANLFSAADLIGVAMGVEIVAVYLTIILPAPSHSN